MKREESDHYVPDASAMDARFQFLQTQIPYLTSHLQIADAKAAGLVAYISVLSGYTASEIKPRSLEGPDLWLVLAIGAFSALSLTAAFLAIIPRGWPGADPDDPFSWVGLSSAAATNPYPGRVPQLTEMEMHHALADAAETCALIIRRKYNLVSISVLASLLSTLLQGASWFILL